MIRLSGPRCLAMSAVGALFGWWANLDSASTAEIKTTIKQPRQMPLELALEYIEEDELVEVTPKSIRLRKSLLKEADRKKYGRQQKA